MVEYRGCWPPHRVCPRCSRLTAVRLSGVFHVHPKTDVHCPGSGEAAVAQPDPVDPMAGKRLAYLELLLKLMQRHPEYQPGLCDRAERMLTIVEAAR